MDLKQIFLMKPSEFEISLSVESHDKKLPKISKISMMPKRAVYKPSQISISNYNITILTLE